MMRKIFYAAAAAAAGLLAGCMAVPADETLCPGGADCPALQAR